MTNERFRNQTAIITGGADGLGLHIAARLADEGARVWIADRDQEKGTALIISSIPRQPMRTLLL